MVNESYWWSERESGLIDSCILFLHDFIPKKKKNVLTLHRLPSPCASLLSACHRKPIYMRTLLVPAVSLRLACMVRPCSCCRQAVARRCCPSHQGPAGCHPHGALLKSQGTIQGRGQCLAINRSPEQLYNKVSGSSKMCNFYSYR